MLCIIAGLQGSILKYSKMFFDILNSFIKLGNQLPEVYVLIFLVRRLRRAQSSFICNKFCDNLNKLNINSQQQ